MDLPAEILFYIFSFLPQMTKIIAGLVCRSFRDISQTTRVSKKQLLTDGISYYPPAVLEKMKFHEIFDEQICQNAALYGKLDVLKWARDKGCDWDEFSCSNAAAGGHLDVLIWLHKNGCPWDGWTNILAIRGGHFEIFKYVFENGCDDEGESYENAAFYGRLDILQFLRKNSLILWGRWVCAYAADGGQLTALKWLRENNCPWDSLTCTNAAKRGYLDVLKWAHENNCPWTCFTSFSAARNNQLEVLKYLHENGCDINKQDCIDHSTDEDVIAYLNSL